MTTPPNPRIRPERKLIVRNGLRAWLDENRREARVKEALQERRDRKAA